MIMQEPRDASNRSRKVTLDLSQDRTREGVIEMDHLHTSLRSIKLRNLGSQLEKKDDSDCGGTLYTLLSTQNIVAEKSKKKNTVVNWPSAFLICEEKQKTV